MVHPIRGTGLGKTSDQVSISSLSEDLEYTTFSVVIGRN